MKKILFSAIIAGFAVTAVNAQETSEKKQEKVLHEKQKSGLDNINLTAEQKEKIKTLKEAYKLQIEEMKKEGAPEEKINELKRQHHDQIQALLTGEQKVEWEKMKEAQKEEKQQTLVEKKALPATATQEKETSAKIKAIQQDPTLTEEQKKEKTKVLLASIKEEKKAAVSEEELKIQKKKEVSATEKKKN